MGEQLFYNTIEKPSLAEFKDRGSKFLAQAFPVKTTDDFKRHLQYLKKEHPKAVHHCFAYRLGLDGNNFRVSDDGEPGRYGRYKSATAMSLQLTPILQKQVLVNYQLQFDYMRMNDVMIIIRQLGYEIINQQNQLFCEIEIGIPKARLNEVLFKLKDLQNIDLIELK